MLSSRKIQLKSKVVTQEKIAISRYVLIKDQFLGFQFEVFENQCSNFHLFVDKIWQIFEVISWKKILSKSLNSPRYLSPFLNDLMKKIPAELFKVFLTVFTTLLGRLGWHKRERNITTTKWHNGVFSLENEMKDQWQSKFPYWEGLRTNDASHWVATVKTRSVMLTIQQGEKVTVILKISATQILFCLTFITNTKKTSKMIFIFLIGRF